jgi:hypothetical protein
MNNCSIVTYTNSKCHDVLRVHAGQIEKYSENIKSYIFSDKVPDFDLENHTVITYKNSDPYYTHWVSCLESVKDDFFIYLQEDFFLTDTVLKGELERCKDFLHKSDYSFVRLSRFDLAAGIHRKEKNIKEFPDVELERNIFDAHICDPDSFAFMMQATLWKKKDFIDFYNESKSKLWLESREFDDVMKNKKIKGAFYCSGEEKLGKYHWRSSIWPHICTAIGKGKWSITHHDETLTDILSEYSVNTSIRGTR